MHTPTKIAQFEPPIGSISHDEHTGVPLLMRLGILSPADRWCVFRPDDFITRAELAAIFARLAGVARKRGISLQRSARTTNPQSFVDVPRSHWAYRYVNDIASMGVFCTSSDRFYPESRVTHLELIRWTYNLLGDRLPRAGYVGVQSLPCLSESDRNVVSVASTWQIAIIEEDSPAYFFSDCTRLTAARIVAGIVELLQFEDH